MLQPRPLCVWAAHPDCAINGTAGADGVALLQIFTVPGKRTRRLGVRLGSAPGSLFIS